VSPVLTPGQLVTSRSIILSGSSDLSFKVHASCVFIV
jgi:hypothetical protein